MLPAGVEIVSLTPHADDRGVFTELFRRSWGVGVEPVQWNGVRSGANVLRGVHVHWRHTDYLTLVAGRMTIGLRDLRETSQTAGASTTVELSGDPSMALVVPPGVAHGFYFHDPSIHIYAVSHDWDMEDELGCRWDDPGLGIDWPCTEPLISARDDSLGALSELEAAVRARLATA